MLQIVAEYFLGQEDENSDVIVYIEQREDMRVEITANELAKACLPRIRQWIAAVNDGSFTNCSPRKIKICDHGTRK